MRIGLSRRFEVLLWLAAAVASPAGAVNNGTVQGGLSHQQWPVGVFDPSQLPPTLNGATCSNVLIAPDWVLTAGQCAGSVPATTRVGFYVPFDADGCGGVNGQVAEAYTDPSGSVQLIRLGNTCGLHFTPFILNDGSAPVAGSTLYDLGWGGARGQRDRLHRHESLLLGLGRRRRPALRLRRQRLPAGLRDFRPQRRRLRAVQHFGAHGCLDRLHHQPREHRVPGQQSDRTELRRPVPRQPGAAAELTPRPGVLLSRTGQCGHTAAPIPRNAACNASPSSVAATWRAA